VILMTSSLKLDIRVARDAGGTHLVRSVDEMDLPWLLHLISELQIERAAVVTLTDAERGDELVIMIEKDRYRVERSAAGARAWLASDRVFERVEAAAGPDAPSGNADSLVDLAAARDALHSMVTGQPLEAGARWVGSGG
jgi:hypothetical protein